MDFGVAVGLDRWGSSTFSPSSDHKRFGSGFLKQETSGASTIDHEHDWRTSKLPKTLHDNQMLSFSSPNYYPHPFSAYTRTSSNTGYCSGGVLNGVRGPFTPSQWMELEHQALIYKYITANVPVPSNLLIPIRKAFASAGFSTFAGGLLRPNALGWGSFHMGFSSSTDPEPGRCRRTDGKKWRCSRDAVADQKYCERHMNRGRHRSRKPVEGQAASSAKPAIAQQHLNSLQPCASSAPPNLSASNRMQDSSALSMISPTIDAKSKHNQLFLNQKLQNPFEEFGLVSSDSLLNPSNKSSTLINLSDGESKSHHHSLRQFMDEWPKNQTELDMHSDRTQLSISIPMAPNYHEKVTLSPLRYDPIQMELGVGIHESSSSSRQASWIPISWESSMGGPLGEVLHNNNSTMESMNSSSALNLMTEGWDNSPSLGSSPRGVLQKTAFGSVSNSSAGSSPRAESRTHEGGGHEQS